LSSGFTALQPRRLGTALAGLALGGEVQVHESLPSTSDYVRDFGLAGYPHGLVVLAEEQTAGRGRRENRWTSEPGQDLLLSLLLRPEAPMEEWPRVTTLAALAICRAIEAASPAFRPAIKWPNDVYLDGCKCAGILAETFTSGSGPFMVLGMGVNVNATVYPAELARQATSLRLALGPGPPLPQPLDRTSLAITLIKQLDHLLQRWHVFASDLMNEVRGRSWLLGRPVTARVNGVEVRGTAVALNDEGHLVLRQGDGAELTLTSAEQVRPSV
jgi:BirA family biotin operon repressor/biotin-[acetyl-CoA-carboxylase] ligase